MHCIYLFIYFISFDEFICVTQQMACCNISSIRYIASVVHSWFDGFKPVWLLLQQKGKYEVFHILSYLPRVDISVRCNGSSGGATGNTCLFILRARCCIGHYRILLSYMFSVVLCFACILLAIHPPKWRLHWHFRELAATDVERKHI
jgi:hypothetical protein